LQTATDCVWAGVPLLTFAATAAMQSRVAGGVVRALDTTYNATHETPASPSSPLQCLVCADAAEFERTAVQLATLATSTLTSSSASASAYESMKAGGWRRWSPQYAKVRAHLHRRRNDADTALFDTRAWVNEFERHMHNLA
jgi:hypothetical protein